MPCDTRVKRGQSLDQRKTEVKTIVEQVASKLATGAIKAKVGPTGGITFLGLTDDQRDGVTDACIYRRVMATGSVAAKLAIQQAEMYAGRAVDRHAVAHGHHSHDGGHTWHHHKG